MFAQTKHRFSVKDYHRMAETGVLSPGARVELLHGEIIDRSPIGPFHGGLVNRLIRIFNQNSGGRLDRLRAKPAGLGRPFRTRAGCDAAQTRSR